MTDPILYQFPDPDKMTKRQRKTLLMAMEALAFGVPRYQIARYIADREGVGIRAAQSRLKRIGIDTKEIPLPERPISEKRQWEIDHPGMKRCTKCGQGKPATLEYFGRKKKSKGDLDSVCRDCQKAYFRQRYDPKKAKEYARQWKTKNPERARAITHRRRARLLQAEGSHTAADIRAQYKSQKGKCWYCGKKVGDKYDVDHRVPLSRGGSNAPDNLVIACPTCNRSKHDRLPHEWCGRLL